MTATTKTPLTDRQAELCQQIREFVRMSEELVELARDITDRPRAEFHELLNREDGTDVFNVILSTCVMAENAVGFIVPNCSWRLPQIRGAW